MRTLTTIFITVASLAAVVWAINAFAHGGMGWGGWGHHGQGWHHRGDYGPGTGGEPLSEEQHRQLSRQREAFFEETRDLRASLYEKERELQGELAKTEPNTARASGLQKEISELQALFDQKRLDHVIEMRKLAPNAGGGFMRGGGPGMGYGYGPRGGGYCWR